MRRGPFRPGDSGARHLLRDAAHDATLGGEVRRSGNREFGHAHVRVARNGGSESHREPRLFHQVPSEFGSGRATVTMWGPCRRGLPWPRPAPRRRSWRWKHPSGSYMRCCSTRKSCTPITASRSCGISPMAYAAAPATGRSARSSRSRRSASASRSGRARWSAGSRAASTRRSRRCSIHRAIGDRLTCIFVDNGLLRHDEANQIQKRFREKLQLPLDFVDATELFLDSAGGCHRPRAEAQDHRRHLHRRLRDSARTSWAASTSSARARCIRM